MDFHKIISFLLQNWSLSGLFVILLIWLIFEESKAQGPGRQLSAQQVVALMNRDQAYLVDLREPGVYLNNHIIGANNIKKVDLSANTNQLPKSDDKKIILTNQHQLHQQQQQLQQLQTKYDNSTNNLDELQQQLSSELVSTYIAIRQPYLKLLLSQQNPQHVSRTTMYYHYLYNYQQTLIDQLSQTLETLQSDKQKLADQKAKLSRTIQLQTKQQAALNTTRQQRKSLIKKLNNLAIIDGTDRLTLTRFN